MLKQEQPPNSAAIMKESTADNRPHPQQQKEHLASIPVTSQTTKAKVQASTKPSAKSSGGKSGFPWKTPTQTTAPQVSILQVILFEINCAIFYANLHVLFCQFIS